MIWNTFFYAAKFSYPVFVNCAHPCLPFAHGDFSCVRDTRAPNLKDPKDNIDYEFHSTTRNRRYIILANVLAPVIFMLIFSYHVIFLFGRFGCVNVDI